MLKKKLTIALLFCLLNVTLNACSLNRAAPSHPFSSNSISPTGNAVSPTNSPSSALTYAEQNISTENSPQINAYSAIIHQETTFINANSGTEVYLHEIARTIAPYATFNIVPDYYALIDLNGDKIEEMILTLPITSENFYGYLVLHYESNFVYGYIFNQREFSEIRSDGTFWSSGGATDHGICKIDFCNADFFINQFTYSETLPQGQVQYFVNHQATTEEEFDAAVSLWQENEYVEWVSLGDN